MAQEVAPWEAPTTEAAPWEDAAPKAKQGFFETHPITRESLLGAMSTVAPETATSLPDLVKGLAKVFEIGPNEMDKEKLGRILSYVPGVGPAYRVGAGMGEQALGYGKEFAGKEAPTVAHGAGGLLGTLLTLGLMKKTPEAVESGLDAVGRVPEDIRNTVLRSVDAGPATVSKARQAAETAARERLAAHTAKTAEYRKNVDVARVKARGEYEAGEAARQAETKQRYAEHQAKVAEQTKAHEAKVAAAEAEHAKKVGTVKQKYGEAVSAAEKEKVQQSRIEGRRTSFQRLKDRISEQFTSNVDNAEKTERSSLDVRWSQFRPMLQRAQVNMKPLFEAVAKAKSSILKGSATSIPIFNDILGKDVVGLEEGGVEPLAKMVSADQVRGYSTEMGERMYDAAGLPGDVYRAIKSVREVARGMVREALADTMGEVSAKAYDKLNADWSDYESTWRDKSSGSPLARILSTIRKPMAQKGVPVYRQVGDMVTGKTGEQTIAALARKRMHGADPGLAAKVRWAEKQYSSLPKPKAVAPVERPKFPQYEAPGAPKPIPLPEATEPPKSAKYELPKPPEPLERKPPFDAAEFRKAAIDKEAERLSHLTGWDVASIGYAIRELATGEFPWALGYPVGKRLIAKLLQQPGFREWLAKERVKP